MPKGMASITTNGCTIDLKNDARIKNTIKNAKKNALS